jgi:hypothetical protein
LLSRIALLTEKLENVFSAAQRHAKARILAPVSEAQAETSSYHLTDNHRTFRSPAAADGKC